MHRVNDSIDVAAGVEKIFEVVADFEAYPEWNTNIKEVDVLERNRAGRATKVRMKVDAKFRMITYSLLYDYEGAPERLEWHLIEGDLNQLDGSYRLERGAGVTHVGYEIRVDPGFPVPKLLMRQAERLIVRSALVDLKKRIEGP